MSLRKLKIGKYDNVPISHVKNKWIIFGVLIKCLQLAKKTASWRFQQSTFWGNRINWDNESLKLSTALSYQATHFYILAVYVQLTMLLQRTGTANTSHQKININEWETQILTRSEKCFWNSSTIENLITHLPPRWQSRSNDTRLQAAPGKQRFHARVSS